ncbi:hypothetical protein [Amycolatopsis suaedae]|uniref:DUF4333 domain-containing protein n=1 Tax=Amycolatopsis suaedae TaxID=2510978 RepID=A0A4Q7JBE1_9PSEU|nr:hypothetical protein [Amycolatopsis suaedae]RZQ65140.1 hypothetical protein EWH70_04390 [Amycolatopsis suaedae]
MNRPVALACLLLVTLTACGPRFEEAKTDPVTSPPPTPSPASVERPRDMSGQVTHEVREDAEAMIGGPDPALEVKCTWSQYGQIVPCNARFHGHEVTFTAKIGGTGSSLYTLDISSETRFLTRAYVHREFYKMLVSEEDGEPPAAEDQVRCDKMPEVTTVPIKPDRDWTETGIRCYHYDVTTDVREVWVGGATNISFVTEDEAKRRDWK